MQTKQILSIISLIVGIALLGCSAIGGGEIGTTVMNEPQGTVQENVAQKDDAIVDGEELSSESSESGTGELVVDNVVTIDNTLIQLVDPLDEPEYYCVDVPGFRQSLNLDGALTVHTCKPNAEDELFTINYPAVGQFYMPAYERCMEASTTEAGAELFMTECSDSPRQRFAYRDNDTIQLQSDDTETLCLVVADKAGEPTGGPSHLRRDLMMQPCAIVLVALSQWTFPGPTVP